MDKKKVYVCGKVGKKKFELFKALSSYVTFYDSVRELKNDLYFSYGDGHYDGLPTPDYPFDYRWCSLYDLENMKNHTDVIGDGHTRGYSERVNELVCVPILNADLVVGYFESPDAFGSLVEIGYALGKGKRVLLVFDFNRCRDESIVDAYRFVVLMPGVEVYFVNPESSRGRADLFLHVAWELGINEMPIKKAYLYERQEGKCSGCLVKLPERNLTVDHIVPKVQTDNKHDDRLHNLQLLCQPCNSMKGIGTQERLITRLVEVGLRRVISDDSRRTETGID